MANRAIPRGEITVDARGRVTGFNRIRESKYTRYRAEEHESGVITLTPVISVTPAELADLQMRIEQAHAAVQDGDSAVAAYLLDVPQDDIDRVSGTSS
jgi:hypothetical protein